MKRQWWGITLAIAIVCLTASSALAVTANIFRCPNGSLIYIGDKIATVRAKCDHPTSVTRVNTPKGPLGYSDSSYYETVDVEQWIYNLGPTSFMMYLTFINGGLVTIESGDYGD